MGVFFVLPFSAAFLFLGMHGATLSSKEENQLTFKTNKHKARVQWHLEDKHSFIEGHCAEIVGGHESVPHSRPYMAAIIRRNVLICGGTLIRKNWVLTAAHCDIKLGDKVILGAHSLTKYEKDKQMFQVAKIIAPSNFNRQTFEHDIMLLQLNGNARFSRSVQMVSLPPPYDDVRVGTECRAAGWGLTHGKMASDVLKEITVTILDRSVCLRHYRPDLITMNKLCAGPTNQNGGHCHGDSGGPLMCGGRQRGIISFHPEERCAKPNVPDGYTRLSKEYIRWIENNIQG